MTFTTNEETKMTVRAKFQLNSITNYSYGGKRLRFEAVCDNSTEENRRFNKATPSGHMEMTIDNQEAVRQFELGKFYYADFSPAE